MNKKAQMEIAIIKGILLALLVVSGFYAIEKISGNTNSGDPIVCEWNCEGASWSICNNGKQFRDISKCVPNDERCLRSNAKPINNRDCS